MEQDSIYYPLPLENGMAYLEMPSAITQKDADRLCKMIQALVIPEKQEEL